MKKISFLIILLFITGTIFSCSGSSGSDTETGYVDPGDWTGKTLSSGNKSYNINLTAGGNRNASGIGAYAIIYQGNLSGVDYVGIAIDNFDNSTATSRFKLQIYWQASSILGTSFPLAATEYTAKLLVNGIQYTTPTGPLNLTISDNSDGTGIQSNTYSIEIASPIALTGNTITGAASPGIRAQKY